MPRRCGVYDSKARMEFVNTIFAEPISLVNHTKIICQRQYYTKQSKIMIYLKISLGIYSRGVTRDLKLAAGCLKGNITKHATVLEQDLDQTPLEFRHPPDDLAVPL
jgi:hypothetical protein